MGKRIGIVLFLLFVLAGCMNQEVATTEENVLDKEGQTIIQTEQDAPLISPEEEKKNIILEDLNMRKDTVLNQDYGESVEFGEYVSGVKTRMKTNDKVIALTLDACGGENGSGYDYALMDFLLENKIKANLFINARWIEVQKEAFMELASNPLFEIENHGTEHRPLSTVPKSAWGIASTSTKSEIVDEITDNQEKILTLTGKQPRFFRSGTAFYDDVSVQMAEDLGVEIVNFDVIGDGGATFTKEQVEESMLLATAGSIIILHMNQPNSETAEGVKSAILTLLEQGFSFVHLHEYELE
ncbi:polysaccharide deacetylase family protein [Sutcliffiella halmapala]|uniref:polysaccharide deacetylase family protein n=1 Tax=Sutcliffiella halmapala TaxID=79882 RepID=UPI000994B4E9|nr:polysaccharide deacetylase family protein [Sutcliffiella halmapala]